MNALQRMYHDKICVYDEHLIAGQDIQCRAPYSWSRFTTPFNNYKVICKHVNNKKKRTRNIKKNLITCKIN